MWYDLSFILEAPKSGIAGFGGPRHNALGLILIVFAQDVGDSANNYFDNYKSYRVKL